MSPLWAGRVREVIQYRGASQLPNSDWARLDCDRAPALAFCLPAFCPDPPRSEVHRCSAVGGFSTGDYGIGWQNAAHNDSETWAYSAPDLLG
jgi:hypothetical protein